MTVRDYWSELKGLAQLLTGPDISPGAVSMACTHLYDLLLQVSGLEERDYFSQPNLQLPQGKALAPLWAAYCIRDYRRTQAFLRGVLGAIRVARLKFPNTRIHVLYAGCGPFASLVVPLIPLLEQQTVTFTLLEISPDSLVFLEKTIATLQIGSWIREIVRADASTYRVDPARPVHLLVGEMLQSGLQQEPQVAVMANLVPQITPGGLLVPQCIRVQAGLLDPRRNQARMMALEAYMEPVYALLRPGFELSQATLAAAPDPANFPELVIELPAGREPDFRQLALFTQIQVFGTERLEIWASALTQVVILADLAREERVQKIGLRYRTGQTPGFDWRIIA